MSPASACRQRAITLSNVNVVCAVAINIDRTAAINTDSTAAVKTGGTAAVNKDSAADLSTQFPSVHDTRERSAMLCSIDCEDECLLVAYHCIHHFLYGGYALHIGWVVLLPPWF